ncbi:hypothetical protein F4820DRAFT_138322 [Hypoxylon rubiginosum]|uniref:Uncharacterized protein n=1 Tax=Hypoxylon rubiginosum TaxID=110542 RepID=A0ACB9ZB57_9PEZI|nr:hypothetical protein F4820DRAFT_138322 [Hypoxylon rubiginosum]
MSDLLSILISESRSGALCLLAETPFFFSQSTEDYHSMFIALYWGSPHHGESSCGRALPTREPRNPLLSMNMPINTNPRPCENERINPIPWEDEKKDLGRLPKGKYGGTSNRRSSSS